MKFVLGWIKANPVTVASAVLLVGALVALFLFVAPGGNEFRQKLSKRLGEKRRIERLERTEVEIPPARPDDPPVTKMITVNQAAIDKLRQAYQRMNREYTQTFDLAVAINRSGHVEMLDGLFPKPDIRDAAKPFDAKHHYRESFRQMLGEYSPDAPLPRLDAGRPIATGLVNQALAQVEAEFLQNAWPAKTRAELGPKQLQELLKMKRTRYRDLLRGNAEKIHLYAETDIRSPEFPFNVGPWSQPGDKPAMADIWEGQLGLWIQQDIAEAIARANRVDDPSANVTNVPVKRLIKIDVVPGYVGINGNGGLAGGAVSRPRSDRAGPRPELYDPYDESDMPAAPAPGRRSDAPLQPAPTGVSPDTELPEDFSVAHTGRRSNALYDVRHVWVTLVVDSRQLPQFFNQLAAVNFMTVLKVDLRDVDEYEALRDGYVYGPGDAVQADILLETVWLRKWTAELMPEQVRQDLGIVTEEPAADRITAAAN